MTRDAHFEEKNPNALDPACSLQVFHISRVIVGIALTSIQWIFLRQIVQAKPFLDRVSGNDGRKRLADVSDNVVVASELCTYNAAVRVKFIAAESKGTAGI